MQLRTAIGVDNCLLYCSHQGLVVEAVEGSSSFPLGGHSVHVSETGVVGPPQHPL